MTTSHERPFDDLRSTLGEYGRILRYRWRLGFIALGIVSSIAFWYSQYLPRQYRASTIFERRDDVVLRNLIHRNSPYSFDTLKSTLRMDMTGSRAMAEAAAATELIPAEVIPPQGPLPREASKALDAAVGRYDLSASVHMIQSSSGLDTIRLDCQANDAQIARRFLVALRDRYISVTRERITEILQSTKQFFDSEVDRYQQEVGKTKRALHEQFKDFPGVDPLDLAGAGARLETLRQERTRLLQRKAEVEAQIAAREQFLVSTLSLAEEEGDELSAPAAAAAGARVPPALPESDEVIARAIQDLEQRIADAMTLQRMTAEHPTVVVLSRKLEGLYAARQAIRWQHAQRAQSPLVPTSAPATPQRGPRLRHTAERMRIELELDSLRRQLEIVQASYEESDRRAQRFAELYDRLLKRGEELREIRDELGQDVTTIAMWQQHIGQLNRILSADSSERGTQFVLIEEPKESSQAVSPQVASIFAVCTGSGLAVAALLVALAELLDRSFRSAGQVTRVLGVPVLECVGVIPTPQVRKRRMIGRLVWTPALGLLLGLLLTAGGLAYASLEKPGLHRRAIAKLDGLLHGLGAPGTALIEPNKQ